MLKRVFAKSVICVTVILCSGCSSDSNPSDAQSVVDPVLLGDWLELVDYSAPDQPWRPQEHFSGITIHPDGTVDHLAIETATGRFAVKPIGRSRFFYYCIIGMYERIQGMVPDYYCIRGYYELRGDTLILHDQFADNNPVTTTKTFIRMPLGTRLTKPITVNFSAVIDSSRFESSLISSSPSAYAGIRQSSTGNQNLYIAASQTVGLLSSNHLFFTIEDFHGTGTYPLDKSTGTYGSYSWSSGDMISSYVSKHGSITIAEFDLQQKRCSGSFAFDADEHRYGWRVVNIRNGTFSVPLYY